MVAFIPSSFALFLLKAKIILKAAAFAKIILKTSKTLAQG